METAGGGSSDTRNAGAPFWGEVRWFEIVSLGSHCLPATLSVYQASLKLRARQSCI
ncbi:rCG58915 [Rattus norvegicus]|uniref:RCG58915 n=1 Tax=Rattus norvegicus TaxID=10116 RepID=A6KQ11_RAT|nr:rCG58915 [Rattus norvegicus]